MLAQHGVRLPPSLAAAIGAHAAARRRVVPLAVGADPIEGTALPRRLAAEGIVVPEEGVRADAAATIAFLAREGVEVKVISGDGPETVAGGGARRRRARGRARDRGESLPGDDEPRSRTSRSRMRSSRA